MTQDSPIDIVELRHMMEVLADRFEDEVYRVVTRVAVAAAEVQATAARLSGAEEPVDPAHIRASATATERVSVRLHGIAAAAGELRRSVDQAIREMIAASKQARGGADSPKGIATDVNRLVQGVLLAREIDTLVTDVAGLSNLLDMTLVIEPVHAGSDLAAAAAKVGTLAGHAVWTIEQLSAEIAAIRDRVAAAAMPAGLDLPAAAGRFPLENRAA